MQAGTPSIYMKVYIFTRDSLSLGQTRFKTFWSCPYTMPTEVSEGLHPDDQENLRLPRYVPPLFPAPIPAIRGVWPAPTSSYLVLGTPLLYVPNVSAWNTLTPGV